MSKILALLLTVCGMVVKAEPPAKVEITVAKKVGAAEKGKLPNAGGQAKASEKVVYSLTLKNVAPNELTGLTVDYAFFIERQRLGEAKTDPVKVERTFASQKVEALSRQTPKTLTTAEITLNTENLVGTFHFKNGGRIRAVDSVTGVWVRVSQEGKIIGEYANPPTVTKRGWETH